MFIVMVTFVYLAVLNVISGLFLQTSLEQAQQDKDDIVWQHQADSQKHIRNFQKIFAQVDTDGDGAVSLEEFEEAVSQPTLQNFLKAMDIETTDAWTLFKLLDLDG